MDITASTPFSRNFFHFYLCCFFLFPYEKIFIMIGPNVLLIGDKKDRIKKDFNDFSS